MRRIVPGLGTSALTAAVLCAACGGGITQPSDSPPSAPTNLVAQAASSSEIELRWSYNSPNEQGFEVWRSSGPEASFAKLSSVGAGVTAYTNTNLPAGSPFCYRVRALGVGGASPSGFSVPACATTPSSSLPAPQAPSGLSATATSTSEIDLSWTDNASNEAGFEVWRSTTGPTAGFELLASLPAGTTTYANTGLTVATEYCYKVRALGASGAPASGFTAGTCATTKAGQLLAPTALTATTASTSEIDLTWVNHATDASQIEVWRSPTGSGGPFSPHAFLAANRTTYADQGLSAGTQYCYKVKAVASGRTSSFAGPDCASTQEGPAGTVRITTFGDSNTDTCNGNGGTEIHSYVSVVPRLRPADANLSCQLAGKIEAKWRAIRSNAITAVNHAITGTSSGGGGTGGPDRDGFGSPNARLAHNGVTRFEAEMLGMGYPWNGGEPTNTQYPSGPINRVKAYTPGANDVAYVSIGTNDPMYGMSTSQTITNLTWMLDRWIATGHPANHFIMTTLPPRTDDNYGNYIPTVNTAIRSLVASRGARLIDLCDHLSNDNCSSWASPTLNVGDGVHYGDATRSWIGDQVIGIMSPMIASN